MSDLAAAAAFSSRRRLSLLHRCYHAVARSRVGFLCDARAVVALMRPVLEMPAPDIIVIAQALAARDLPFWVAGGWGVDALLGHQCRRHTDLDLLVPDSPETLQEAVGVLGQLGYELVAERRGTTVLARRLWFADSRGRCVDMMPVHIGAPPFVPDDADATPFTEGVIAGHRVPCVSAIVQQRLHGGYRARAVDARDLLMLRTGVPQRGAASQ